MKLIAGIEPPEMTYRVVLETEDRGVRISLEGESNGVICRIKNSGVLELARGFNVLGFQLKMDDRDTVIKVVNR